MKVLEILKKPAVLGMVASWVMALTAHLGLNVPADLVYGAASIVSLLLGGNEVRKARKASKE